MMLRFTSAVRKSLETHNWYGALAVTLTLPDICGKIDYPEIKSRERYARWFDEHLKPYYTTVNHRRVNVFLSGSDCYALRCSYLHLGGDDTTEQTARETYSKYWFTTDNAHLINVNGESLTLNVRLFCTEVCNAVDAWASSRSANPVANQRFEALLRIHSGDLSPSPGITMHVAPDPLCIPRSGEEA